MLRQKEHRIVGSGGQLPVTSFEATALFLIALFLEVRGSGRSSLVAPVSWPHWDGGGVDQVYDIVPVAAGLGEQLGGRHRPYAQPAIRPKRQVNARRV
jgi:hypothetical protein